MLNTFYVWWRVLYRGIWLGEGEDPESFHEIEEEERVKLESRKPRKGNANGSNQF